MKRHQFSIARRVPFIGFIIVVAVGLWIVGCVMFSPKAVSVGPAIAPEAGDVKVCCFMKEFKGKVRATFECHLKNVSDKPQRFKVIFDIVDGPSQAIYAPRRGKPPALKPGADITVTLPSIYESMPKGFYFSIVTVPIP